MRPTAALKRDARAAFPEPTKVERWVTAGIVHGDVTLPVLDGWLVRCRPEHNDAAVEMLQAKAKAAGVNICILTGPT